MRRGNLSGLLLLCAASACSSSTGAPVASGGVAPGAATVVETFPFAPAQFQASAAALRDESGHVSLVVTSMRGAPSCSLADMGGGTAVAGVLRIAVALDGTGAMAPGMYTLGDGWQASYRMADALCAASGEGAASKGTLEIDSAGASLRGVMDMTFPAGRVIATFDAPVCDAPTASPVVVGQACTHLPSCPEPQGSDLNPTPTAACNAIF